jgi:hypothetical protein
MNKIYISSTYSDLVEHRQHFKQNCNFSLTLL